MVNDENSRIRIQDPDPLVRGMDPRIRIRIHRKMSWIRNTGKNNANFFVCTLSHCMEQNLFCEIGSSLIKLCLMFFVFLHLLVEGQYSRNLYFCLFDLLKKILTLVHGWGLREHNRRNARKGRRLCWYAQMPREAQAALHEFHGKDD